MKINKDLLEQITVESDLAQAMKDAIPKAIRDVEKHLRSSKIRTAFKTKISSAKTPDGEVQVLIAWKRSKTAEEATISKPGAQNIYRIYILKTLDGISKLEKAAVTSSPEDQQLVAENINMFLEKFLDYLKKQRTFFENQ